MSESFAVPALPVPSVAVRGGTARFPVHRIYCVGRNFADHAAEMGASIDRGHPVFFMKPADAVVPGGGDMPFPLATRDLHHEVELVVALGRDACGEVTEEEADALVFGHGVGLDLTRRDLQAQAKERRLPWDTAKGFDRSAPVSELVPASLQRPATDARLWLEVNGALRQQASLDTMVWSVAEVIAALSRLYALRAGDLVFMGTPAGVAALSPGDRFRAGIDGLVEFEGGFAAS